MIIKEYLKMLHFQQGDFNGFLQLFFDNTATLLALVSALQFALRGFGDASLSAEMSGDFGDELAPLNDFINRVIFARMIPGLGVAMIVGNFYYTFMGARLGVAEKREDVTALPYGVNTPGAFAFIFSVMGPVAFAIGSLGCNSALPLGSTEDARLYEQCWEGAVESAWIVGVQANLLAGGISVFLGLFGDVVNRFTPQTALLTSLAGIGFAFLGLAQISLTFAFPLAGFIPFYLAVLGYFADVKMGPMPISIAVVLSGVIMSWATGLAKPEDVQAAVDLVKVYGIHGIGSASSSVSTDLSDYLGTVIPVALAAAMSTLMNVFSAEQAGDKYNLKETMISDGVGTMLAGVAGCPFGTSVYIGHPAYKKMGAKVGYSLLNGVIFFLLSIFGIFSVLSAIIPGVVVAPLIFFVGVMIGQEVFEFAPRRHFPAIIFGLMPAVADWALTTGLDRQSVGSAQYYGYLAMGKSSLLFTLVIVAIACATIDRDFLKAALWGAIGAILSGFGMIHQDTVTIKDYGAPLGGYCDIAPLPSGECPAGTTSCLRFGLPNCGHTETLMWQFAIAYSCVAFLSLISHFFQKRDCINPKIQDADEDPVLPK